MVLLRRTEVIDRHDNTEHRYLKGAASCTHKKKKTAETWQASPIIYINISVLSPISHLVPRYYSLLDTFIGIPCFTLFNLWWRSWPNLCLRTDADADAWCMLAWILVKQALLIIWKGEKPSPLSTFSFKGNFGKIK